MSRQEFRYILMTSVGFILAFPPFPAGITAMIAFVPFFFYLQDNKIKGALKGGYITGFIWGAGTLYWIGWSTSAGVIAALLYWPVFFTIYAMLQRALWNSWGERSLFAAPFLWTGMELFSSVGALGFPWNSLGYTQTYFPVWIQFASITGVYGITFWIVCINVLVYFLIRKFHDKRIRYRLINIILIVLLIPLLHGWITMKKQRDETNFTLSLIQGNIDPYKKWSRTFVDSNFVIYNRLTRDAAQENPDMVVWPETATPCYLRYHGRYLRLIKSLIDSIGIPLLTGAPDYAWKSNRTQTFNSALFIQPEEMKIERYYKMRLVPFSERVPLREKAPFLYNFAKHMDLAIGDFAPGDSLVVFKSRFDKHPFTFSTIICFESVFPLLIQKCVQKGAQFIVLITNDGWFGKTSGPYQHAQISVIRAIENRVWIARCANTGISGFIDPFGRYFQRTRFNETAVVTQQISLKQDKLTCFSRYGKLWIWLLITTNFLIVLLFLANKINQKFLHKQPEKL